MKKYFLKSWKSLSILILMAACASAPILEINPFDSSKTYMNDFDTQWSKLVRFFSTNSVGIGNIEKDSGLITVDNVNLDYGLIKEYCPNAASHVPMLWSPLGGTIRGSVTLTDEDEFTTANVNVRFQVVSQYCYQGCQTKTERCDSGGAFEKAVLDALN